MVGGIAPDASAKVAPFSSTDMVQLYSITNDSWRSVAPLTKPLNHPNVAAANGKISVFGRGGGFRRRRRRAGGNACGPGLLGVRSRDGRVVVDPATGAGKGAGGRGRVRRQDLRRGRLHGADPDRAKTAAGDPSLTSRPSTPTPRRGSPTLFFPRRRGISRNRATMLGPLLWRGRYMPLAASTSAASTRRIACSSGTSTVSRLVGRRALRGCRRRGLHMRLEWWGRRYSPSAERGTVLLRMSFSSRCLMRWKCTTLTLPRGRS
ncbi:Kelch-type beta propeller [Macrophomina phaseolina MS6]|uniref:Kelch-type beta propeller n=1 Tax=Macrophomina phaseolina (strain MS6) TaxID=1126212 RepID=K2S6Y9_MACPH|nr:Kelch-type beta propeller [Macrophomina phaseolina MS6]